MSNLSRLLIANALFFSVGLVASSQQSDWSGSAEGTFALTTGNTSTHNIGAGGEVNYKPEAWSALARAQYYRSFANGTENSSTVSGLIRGSKALVEQLEAFAQVGYFRNPYAGIVDRYSPEAGVSYSFLDGKPHLLRVEVAGGYIIEHVTAGGNREFVNGRAGAEYRWKFSDNAELFDEASYVYNFKNSSDWRVTNAVGVAVAMTPLLSLKVSYGIQYLNRPVLGFKSTDSFTTAALVAKF